LLNKHFSAVSNTTTAAVMECQVPHESYLPKRLIEVVQTPGDEKYSLRLVDDGRSNVASDSSYAALSYCWGEESIIKTTMLKMTKGKLSAMTQSLLVADLPPVLKDAVTVTTPLRLSYLWMHCTRRF
jgi:hypothetical protein